jgi:hypothetical protein
LIPRTHSLFASERLGIARNPAGILIVGKRQPNTEIASVTGAVTMRHDGAAVKSGNVSNQ